jgi:hypothetical protein
MFLMVNYAPVSDANDKREFWKEITDQQDILSFFFFFFFLKYYFSCPYFWIVFTMGYQILAQRDQYLRTREPSGRVPHLSLLFILYLILF